MGPYLGINRSRKIGTLSSRSNGTTIVGRAVEGNRVVFADLIPILAAPLVTVWNVEANGHSCGCPSQVKLRNSEQHSTVPRGWVSRHQKVGTLVLICHSHRDLGAHFSVGLVTTLQVDISDLKFLEASL